MDREKIRELMFRIWWWARVYALYAAILFAILWVIANCCSGCASPQKGTARERESPTVAIPDEPLSMRLSRMMEEMRKAGCWPMEFGLVWSNPTNYSISVSGKYYDALDQNRTNLVNRTEGKGN